VQGLASLNDVIITVCMCYWLYQRKAGTGGWSMGDAFGYALVDVVLASADAFSGLRRSSTSSSSTP
jgi:hypothetical protein